MNWFYLILAGVFEIGWPLGLKISQHVNYRIAGIIFSVISMILSGVLLWIAQKTIPIGTAYAVWTGIGAVGTVIIGIILFNDSASIWRMLAVLLIIIGIVGLRITN